MPRKNDISAIIITNPDWFNRQQLLEKCLRSVDWVDEIILVPSKINNELKNFAKKFKAKLVPQKGDNFSDWRNTAAREAKSRWLFYIDDDERCSVELSREIQATIQNVDFQAYDMPRSNRILGKEMRHAGWWPDYVLRLIKTTALVKWQGALHEQPVIKGSVGRLKNPILHIKHNNLEDMLMKTIKWSKSEGELLYSSGHPQLSTLRFIRLTIHPFITNFLNRYLLKKGFLDGTEGLIDAIYQSYSQFISFAQLWERQIRTKSQP